MNNKMTYSVRIVAGLYLIYTSYNLLKDVINGVSKIQWCFPQQE